MERPSPSAWPRNCTSIYMHAYVPSPPSLETSGCCPGALCDDAEGEDGEEEPAEEDSVVEPLPLDGSPGATADCTLEAVHDGGDEVNTTPESKAADSLTTPPPRGSLVLLQKHFSIYCFHLLRLATGFDLWKWCSLRRDSCWLARFA